MQRFFSLMYSLRSTCPHTSTVSCIDWQTWCWVPLLILLLLAVCVCFQIIIIDGYALMHLQPTSIIIFLYVNSICKSLIWPMRRNATQSNGCAGKRARISCARRSLWLGRTGLGAKKRHIQHSQCARYIYATVTHIRITYHVIEFRLNCVASSAAFFSQYLFFVVTM